MTATPPELGLVISTIGYILNAVVGTSIGAFVLIKAPGKISNRIFFLFTLTASLFFLSHIIGINVHDPHLSRAILMFNLVTLLNAPITAHLAFSIAGILEKEKKMLHALYAAAFALVAFFLLFPDTFLLPSAPKLYFPNFYAQGSLYFIGDLYFYLTVIYLMSKTLRAYYKADIILRTRIKYVIFGLFSGYLMSLIPALPLYNVDVDPILSAFVWLPYIPIAYTVVKQDLLDIHIIAKQALIYSSAVAIVGILVGGFTYLSVYLAAHNPLFPRWILPLITALIGVEAARLVWRRLRQSEEIRHEFINVVTHKFRTPLTYIKWSLDALKKAGVGPETGKAVSTIENAQVKLTELTEVLVAAASLDDKTSQYMLEEIDLKDSVSSLTRNLADRIAQKNLRLSVDTPKSVWITGDRKRIEFALQMLLENSMTYTPSGGRITVSLHPAPALAILKIEDSGIGIKKEEIPHLFQKFYRSSEATVAHTEGMGIGLYTARTIIEHHGGKISAASEGINKGTVVTVAFKAIAPPSTQG